MKLIPLDLSLRLLSISKPTFISFSGSEAKDILIVSPIPSNKRTPRPMEDLTVPDLNPPASVIPKWRG